MVEKIAFGFFLFDLFTYVQLFFSDRAMINWQRANVVYCLVGMVAFHLRDYHFLGIQVNFVVNQANFCSSASVSHLNKPAEYQTLQFTWSKITTEEINEFHMTLVVLKSHDYCRDKNELKMFTLIDLDMTQKEKKSKKNRRR